LCTYDPSKKDTKPRNSNTKKKLDLLSSSETAATSDILPTMIQQYELKTKKLQLKLLWIGFSQK